jgi:hypothetical protein
MVCNVDIIFPGNYRQLNTSVFPHRKIWNAIIVIDRRTYGLIFLIGGRGKN